MLSRSRLHLTSLFVLAAALTACGDDSPADQPDTGGDSALPDAGPDTAGVNLPVDGAQSITGLLAPVSVVRDKNGMVHIYARHTVDAMRVEGYQVARDRTAQLELVRRTAIGSVAELAGDDSLASDIATRAVGMRRVAQAMYDALSPDSAERKYLDAYADGITQFNARAQLPAGDPKHEKLPAGMIGVPVSALRPWTGADVLAVARLQAFSLSYTADQEVRSTQFVTASKGVFKSDATDPLHAARAGFLIDAYRFAPLDPTPVLPGFPDDAMHTMSTKPAAKAKSVPTLKARLPTPKFSQGALATAEMFNKGVAQLRTMFGPFGEIGSNNWIVGPSLTSTGRVMVASDPHLTLSAPPTFWMVHLVVENEDPNERLDAAGLAFPGIAGIILGFNESIAWGATTAYYDVNDVYQETLTADGKAVVFKGANVPLQTVRETIPLGDGRKFEYDVQIVPHHGPILPDFDKSTGTVKPASGTALSTKWTGQETTNDIRYLLRMLRAKNVEDARVAYRDFATGAQNWVIGDTAGNVFYTSQANLPKRDKRAFTWDPATFSGTLPTFILPGDGSAEWLGYLEERYVPHAKNPAAGYIATANSLQVPRPSLNDPSSTVLPNGEPFFVSGVYDTGFRQGRVHTLIENLKKAGKKITLEDMAAIQGDTRSPYGAFLTASILESLAKAKAEKATPGTHPALTAIVADPRYAQATIDEVVAALTAWGAAGYDAASGVDPDTNLPIDDPQQAAKATALFNAWLYAMTGLTFHDELTAIGQTSLPAGNAASLAYLLTADRTKLATYDATLGDSTIFDDLTTTAKETRDERVVRAMLDAVTYLEKVLGADRTKWRWGSLHTIRFTSLVAFWPQFSIPALDEMKFLEGFPRPGDIGSVDVAAYGLPVAKTMPSNATAFSYRHGPTQRFVIDIDAAGMKARNALPGGNVWDPADKHFRDEAEYWRKNQNHPVVFSKADVVSNAEKHVVYSSP